ncbi:MAG: NAD(P)-dependent oxidoreductase [Proteobacteria bacterium]|nr:NAD(P)-dependent oxidoreductase [Pseudomonadota bacterium]
MTKKIVLFGASGFLGTRFQHYFAARKNWQMAPFTHAQADVTNISRLRAVLDEVKPDAVINATAFLNTDRCEKEPEASYRVNFLGARNLAELCAERGACLIQFSTDYVFDGKTGGYAEESIAHPLSYYGLHKYLADEAMLKMKTPGYILRIASLIGAGADKSDLVKALLGRVARGARKLDVVNDLEISVSTPQFLAGVITGLLEKQAPYGLYHTVGAGQTTWLDAMCVAFEELGVDIPLAPISSNAFPRLGPRPQKSWMKTEKLAGVLGRVPSWQEIIRAQTRDLKESYLAILKQTKAA